MSMLWQSVYGAKNIRGMLFSPSPPARGGEWALTADIRGWEKLAGS
jgi:hypothetical protein